MVDVGLIHKDQSLETTALIDSGAALSVIPRRFARALGLDLTKELKKAVGAGGAFGSINSLVDKCQLMKNNVVFEEFVNLCVDVPAAPEAIQFMILGRDSIFQRFSVKFVERAEKIVLERY